VAVFALLLALILSCVGIIAYFWDTPHRVAAIAWLAGGFLAVAVVALWYRASRVKARSPFLADVRREWQEDRVILDRILSADEEPQ
jgi:cephalosporin-C deacetylase-like acetyl esterase